VACGLLRAGIAALGLALLAPACAGSDDRAPTDVQLIRVAERDFRISAKPALLHAGTVRFAVENKGPVAHELLVVRTADSTLPLRADGLTVDEDAIEHETLGVLEPERSGSKRELQLDLRPGRYELICNMSGHYLGGMHARLLVR
jgi:uncharacterized cupredoxin-like copper-binding protein